ncbi:MAG TPA: hypothetical protein VF658_21480 [Pyrinomonadaceae bacterium]
MRRTTLYITACLLTALIPLLPGQSGPRVGEASSAVFPGWPTHFEGRALTALPLTEREQRFGRDFPGRIARFTDGQREVIVRWVTEPTRKLHPASDCFKGIGYQVRPLPLHVDETGARWGSFNASRGNEKLRVRERIYTDAQGGSWADVSAWYWAAFSEKSTGPWWALTIAEQETEAGP